MFQPPVFLFFVFIVLKFECERRRWPNEKGEHETRPLFHAATDGQGAGECPQKEEARGKKRQKRMWKLKKTTQSNV